MIRADILNPVTHKVVDSCGGADLSGHCPRADGAGLVPCAGRVLAAEVSEVGWALRIPVGSQATKCPIRCFRTPSH